MATPDRRIRFASRTTSAAAIVAAALVPKCPLCVAAVLSALGLGSACATFLAGVARPFVFAFAATAIVLLGFVEIRRFMAKRRTHMPTSCCAKP